MPVTGYASVPDKAGNIARFEFVSSPWVDLHQAHKNVGQAILRSPEAPVKLSGGDVKRAAARAKIEGAMAKFQKQRDRGLHLHEDGNHLSIRLVGSDSDYVPFVRVVGGELSTVAGDRGWRRT